jgi:hypothetical protein
MLKALLIVVIILGYSTPMRASTSVLSHTHA